MFVFLEESGEKQTSFPCRIVHANRIWYNSFRKYPRGVKISVLFLTPVEEKALREFSSRIKAALADNLRDVKLFGSKSTGKFRDESDLDVLIIVNQRNEEVFDTISDILLDVELKYNSKISPVVLSTSEFIKNAEYQTLFYREIARDGVTL